MASGEWRVLLRFGDYSGESRNTQHAAGLRSRDGSGGAGGRIALYANSDDFSTGGGTLSATGGSGAGTGEDSTITTTAQVMVRRCSPQAADFTASPTSGSGPLTVTFTNLSSPGDEIEGYQWSFGDGATSTLTDPVHVYNQVGAFTVILTATAGSESDVESKAGYVSVSGVPALVTRTITYTYDGLYRLTEADYSSGERFEYAYDAVGNRSAYTATVEGTQVTTYSYDAANGLSTPGEWPILGVTRVGCWMTGSTSTSFDELRTGLGRGGEADHRHRSASLSCQHLAQRPKRLKNKSLSRSTKEFFWVLYGWQRCTTIGLRKLSRHSGQSAL